MQAELLKALATSGPVALVLGIFAYMFWLKLQTVTKELIKCKDDCRDDLAELVNGHKEELSKVNESHKKEVREMHNEQIALMTRFSKFLANLMEDE